MNIQVFTPDDYPAIGVHAKVDTVGEFKLRPKLVPGLQMLKFWFWPWADAATNQRADGG